MKIKTDRTELLPGMGIDMQAIAFVTSSQLNSTKALLRAILDVSVNNLSEQQEKKLRNL